MDKTMTLSEFACKYSHLTFKEMDEKIEGNEAELAKWKELVREMVELLTTWNDLFPCAETYEILNRPEVVELMREEGCK